MEETIKILPNFKKFNSYIEDVKSKTSPIMLSGLTDMGKVHFAYSTFFYTEKPICIVTYNEIQAKKIISDLHYFTKNVEYFPRREILTYDYLAESREGASQRIDCLNKIYNKKAKVIVTTIEAISQPIISMDALYKNVLKLKTGDNVDLEELKQNLVNLGYERKDLVEAREEFSIRGGIVDIAISANSGVRIELWGEEIDSIRIFNILDQKSIEKVKTINIYPAHEFVLERDIEEIINDIEEKDYLETDIEEIRQGNYLEKVDKYFNSFYQNPVTFIDYLKDDFIVFLDEISKIKARSINIINDNQTLIKSLKEKSRYIPESLEEYKDYVDFSNKIKDLQTIYLEKQDVGFVDKQSMHAKRNGYSFSYREVNFFRSSMDLLLEEIQKGSEEGKSITIICGNKDNVKKTKDILLKNDIEIDNIVITEGNISAGFECYDFNLLVFEISQIFEKNRKPKRLSQEFKQSETIIFSDLKPGDYIVHKTNGIGEFVGINTIKTDKIVKDYVKIKYRDGDILYIPTDSLDNIRKYIGGGEKPPKLNRLGTKEWEQAKDKVRRNLREVAKELIELYAKREKAKGFVFSKDTEWQRQFEDAFPYVETDDQLRSIEEMKKDMESERPMDRLLCGDVGYGKTEVALRGAFKACMDQKQVAYLVPTTILANQQYEAFKERLSEYPIRVALLNRFVPKEKQEEIVKKLKLGEIDIVIGTHRLLSNDVEFKNLGFLIIDEEHRFGVKDKEKIKLLKTNVDVLTMTATPIPRTLHMSIVGMRDMSCLYEPPKDRRPVQTYVLEYDKEVIKEAITKELERDGQVFYLYNNVEGIEKKAEEISKLVPEAKVTYAHGKMSGKDIEDIMYDYINKKTNVIVCTTILESGIDIPNANTIIVENADRLGLAQLYQIRGRVGRSDRQAYAYITYKRDKLISEVADKRLKAIKEFTEFGSGFKIAMRDLEIRGAGSVLGEMQHGHLDQVGYDTYCKILDQVVKEEKGIKVEEEQDVLIDINVSSFIPNSYIENEEQKLEVYQDIALCRTEEDIQKITQNIEDRFGKMPEEMTALLDIIRIKETSRKRGILKIMQKQNNIVFYFDQKLFNLDIEGLINKYGDRIKFSTGLIPYVTYKIKNTKDIINEIKEFLDVNNK